MESLEPRQMFSATPLSFHVVDDATTNRDYRYTDSGGVQSSNALVAANAAPRGVASTIGVDKTWVIDANRNVYIYNASGSLLGSWSAGSLASNATPEGIATDGSDVWVLDSRSDKVYCYAGAASRLSGSQVAASSFILNGSNLNPKDVVTDGFSMWVVDDGAKTDKVFKYTVVGGLVGSWTIDAANKTPTGLALDSANVGDMWIADSGSDRVYKYGGAAGRNAGSQPAASSFALASGNGNAQGLVVAGRPWAETPPSVEWVRQFGSAGDELGLGVGADGDGNVYWSGQSRVGADIVPLLTSYNDAGDPQWTLQQPAVSGTSYTGVRVETDSLGNVFQIVSPTSDGPSLNNYDAAGTLRWTTSFGVGEQIYGVTADDLGFAYVSSYESDRLHLRKFDGATGAVAWEQILDTGDYVNTSGLYADGLGNIFVVAYIHGSVIGPSAGLADGMVAKFSDAGALLWARQFGSAGEDLAWDLATDALGNVYAVGQTSGSLAGPNAGQNDNFVIKYDAAGNLQWKRQIGTTSDESFNGVWADPAGNVYAAGWTRGALGGPGSGAVADAVLVKFSTAGDHLWSMQLGSIDRDAANDVFGDSSGNIYLAGNSRGSWGGPNAGGADAVLVKLTPPPAATSSVRIWGGETDLGDAPASNHDLAFAAMAWERVSFKPGSRGTLSGRQVQEIVDGVGQSGTWVGRTADYRPAARHDWAPQRRQAKIETAISELDAALTDLSVAAKSA